MSSVGTIGAHIGVSPGMCSPLDDDAFPAVGIERGVVHGMGTGLVAKTSSSHMVPNISRFLLRCFRF